MDDKKLRKISKKELLEILLSQAKRIEELETELKKTQSKLESKKIAINEAGSLAEASLKLNGIFEAAEASVNQYMLNIKEKCKKIENDTKKSCQLEKENMIKETEKICQEKKKEANEYLAAVELKVKELTKDKEKTTSKKTTKTKNNTSKKKDTTKSKIKNIQKSNTTNKKTNENKIVIEKSRKSIKSVPVITKKRNAS